MKQNNLIILDEWKKQNQTYAPKKQPVSPDIDTVFNTLPFFFFEKDGASYSLEDENMLSGMIIW